MTEAQGSELTQHYTVSINSRAEFQIQVFLISKSMPFFLRAIFLEEDGVLVYEFLFLFLSSQVRGIKGVVWCYSCHFLQNDGKCYVSQLQVYSQMRRGRFFVQIPAVRCRGKRFGL